MFNDEPTSIRRAWFCYGSSEHLSVVKGGGEGAGGRVQNPCGKNNRWVFFRLLFYSSLPVISPIFFSFSLENSPLYYLSCFVFLSLIFAAFYCSIGIPTCTWLNGLPKRGVLLYSFSILSVVLAPSCPFTRWMRCLALTFWFAEGLGGLFFNSSIFSSLLSYPMFAPFLPMSSLQAKYYDAFSVYVYIQTLIYPLFPPYLYYACICFLFSVFKHQTCSV